MRACNTNPTQPTQLKPIVKKPLAEHSMPTPPSKSGHRQVDMSELHFEEQQPEDDDIQEVVPVVKQEPASADTPVTHPVVSQTQSYQNTPGAQLETVLTSIDDAYGEEGYEDYNGYGEEYGDSSMIGGAGGGHDPSKGFFSNHDESIASLIIHEGTNIYTCGRSGKTCNKKDHLKRHI